MPFSGASRVGPNTTLAPPLDGDPILSFSSSSKQVALNQFLRLTVSCTALFRMFLVGHGKKFASLEIMGCLQAPWHKYGGSNLRTRRKFE